jgi:hypothetical protein
VRREEGGGGPVGAARARRESRQGRGSAGAVGRAGRGAGTADAHEDGGTRGRHRPRRDQVRDDPPAGTVRPTIDRRRLGGPGSSRDAARGRRDADRRTMPEPLGRPRRQAVEAQAPGDRSRQVRRPRRRRSLLWAQRSRAGDPRGRQQHAPQPRAPEPRDHRSAQAGARHCTQNTPVSHVAPPMAASAERWCGQRRAPGPVSAWGTRSRSGGQGTTTLSPDPHRPWASVTQRDHARAEPRQVVRQLDQSDELLGR